jgi:hypothetical protein
MMAALPATGMIIDPASFPCLVFLCVLRAFAVKTAPYAAGRVSENNANRYNAPSRKPMLTSA